MGQGQGESPHRHASQQAMFPLKSPAPSDKGSQGEPQLGPGAGVGNEGCRAALRAGMGESASEFSMEGKSPPQSSYLSLCLPLSWA